MKTAHSGPAYQSVQLTAPANYENAQQPQQEVVSGNDDSSFVADDSSNMIDDVPITTVVSIDEAIERLGYGRFQRKILLAAGLCFSADSMEVLLLSFLAKVVQQEWELSDEQTASITSSVFAGAMLGTLVLGPLGDRVGRRPIFCVAATVISVFGMATSLAQNFHQLLLVRFVVGFGVGGLTVPFDTLAEFLPTSNRGKNLLYIEYFWAVGTLLVPAIAYITLGAWGSWRWFVFLCALPCFASAALGVCVVPESPRWLCANDRSHEAIDILRKAAAENGLDEDWVFPPGTILRENGPEHHSTVKDLFSAKWRHLTLTLWGAWLGFSFGYYGTILAITQVFADEGNSEAIGDDGRYFSESDSYDFDYAAIFTSGAGEVFGTTLVVLTIDRFGRIPSQLVSFLLGGISVFMLCVIVATSASPRFILILLAFLSRTFEMSGTCVAWVSTAELLPTEIRASGHSAANAIARVGGFVAPFLVEDSTPFVVVGVVMLATHAFTSCCVSKLPETKGVAIGAATPTGQSSIGQALPSCAT